MRIPSKLWALLLLAVAGACAGAPSRDLTVSAAASLTEAFTELAKHYEEKHPETRVHLNFGASGSLVQQIIRGAPVDVFASADQETMGRAQSEGLVLADTRHDFAVNSLVVIVPTDSKSTPTTLRDLEQASIQRIAMGSPATVPAGRYAQQAMQEGGVWSALSTKVIHTQNVRQALDYVARGEVDAAFVYTTDVKARRESVNLAFAVPLSTAIRYPIAPISGAKQPEEAARFVSFVRSEQGQAIMRRYGFLSP